jgi:hypothetical protein
VREREEKKENTSITMSLEESYFVCGRKYLEENMY